MIHATGRALWLLLGGVVALLLLLHFSAPGAELESWLRSGKQEHDAVQTVLARDALHRKQSAALRKKLSDSLGALLIVVKTQQAAGAQLLAQAQTVPQLRAAAEVIARAGQTCASGLVLCQQRGDSLAKADSIHSDSLRRALQASDTALASGLKLAQCKWLFVACPSRTRALEVGLVLGVLGTLVLKR